ncbi:MAG: hypothetical protein EBV83_09020, partial [Verrucomicrobia bacterium]|nr:hypothetical protein [Verrucomicrobiota bacterium]
QESDRPSSFPDWAPPQPVPDFSVAGTTTLADSSAVGINLGNNNNNLQGTITVTQSGGGNVAIGNKNSSVLGNIGLSGGGGLQTLTVTSTGGSIYQFNNANVITVPGAASFFATANGLATGTPVGAVILNNALNSFGGSVSAAGTLVVIRDSGALNLGTVTASTSLVATATSGNITQSGAINSTGLASFAAAAGQSILLGNGGNVFGSTVSFNALSGQLLNLTVVDSTALQLGAINITGSLIASGAGLTQATGTAISVGGTSTLTAGALNNIDLSLGNNFTGAVQIVSGNNVTLQDTGAFRFGAGVSTVSGNLVVTANGLIDQTGVVNVGGTSTLTAGLLNNIDLSLGNNFTGAVQIVSANNVTLRNISSAALFPTLSAAINDLTLTYNNAPIVIPSLPAPLNVNGQLNLTGVGISQSAGAGGLTTLAPMTLNGLGGAIVLSNPANIYGGTVTITGGASADIFFSNEDRVGPVSVAGTFTLRTPDFVPVNLAGLGGTGAFDVPDTTLANFNVGTFAPVASGVIGNGITISSPFNAPGIQGLFLTTQGGGNIAASAAITTGTLSLNSSGSATFSSVNSIANLGSVSIGNGS